MDIDNLEYSTQGLYPYTNIDDEDAPEHRNGTQSKKRNVGQQDDDEDDEDNNNNNNNNEDEDENPPRANGNHVATSMTTGHKLSKQRDKFDAKIQQMTQLASEAGISVCVFYQNTAALQMKPTSSPKIEIVSNLPRFIDGIRNFPSIPVDIQKVIAGSFAAGSLVNLDLACIQHQMLDATAKCPTADQNIELCAKVDIKHVNFAEINFPVIHETLVTSSEGITKGRVKSAICHTGDITPGVPRRTKPKNKDKPKDKPKNAPASISSDDLALNCVYMHSSDAMRTAIVARIARNKQQLSSGVIGRNLPPPKPPKAKDKGAPKATALTRKRGYVMVAPSFPLPTVEPAGSVKELIANIAPFNPPLSKKDDETEAELKRHKPNQTSSSSSSSSSSNELRVPTREEVAALAAIAAAPAKVMPLPNVLPKQKISPDDPRIGQLERNWPAEMGRSKSHKHAIAALSIRSIETIPSTYPLSLVAHLTESIRQRLARYHTELLNKERLANMTRPSTLLDDMSGKPPTVSRKKH